jgi:hypothetical protein
MRVTHLQGQPHKNTGARLTTVPFINVFIKISLAEIFYRFQLLEIGLEKSAWRWCFILFQVARRGAGAQEPSVIAAKGFGYFQWFPFGCCWPSAVLFPSPCLAQIMAFCLLLTVSQWPCPQRLKMSLSLWPCSLHSSQVESELRRRGNMIALKKRRVCDQTPEEVTCRLALSCF